MLDDIMLCSCNAGFSANLEWGGPWGLAKHAIRGTGIFSAGSSRLSLLGGSASQADPL
jgi:hypothetical protein